MTGNKIYHLFNAPFDWVDCLDWRGDSRAERKAKKARLAYAKNAKHKERNAAKRAIKKELNTI